MILRHVLIVDDDSATRELLAAIVGRQSCESVQCGDGGSALALLQTRSFDAVLLDLLLPELSGFEVIAYLSAEKPQMLLRVVVITAASPALWDGQLGQVQCVIRKPFDVVDVETAMTACWNGH